MDRVTGPREANHRLVGHAARRADEVVLDRLGEFDDAEAWRDLESVGLEQGRHEVHAERCRARHPAAGDLAEDRDVEAASERVALTAQDGDRAVRIARPTGELAGPQQTRRQPVRVCGLGCDVEVLTRRIPRGDDAAVADFGAGHRVHRLPARDSRQRSSP
jgi:hypothetical protein